MGREKIVLKPQDRPIIGRYARALFAAARARKAVDAVRRDLTDLLKILVDTPALAEALRHPRLPGAVKAEIVGKAGAAPLLAAFAGLLFEKGRWDALPEIATTFDALADEAAGVLSVGVTAAAPWTAVERDRWQKTLETAHGGPVRVDARVDPALLGGTTIRVGDRVWDNSLRNQLERLRASLAATRAA